ncbi:protein S40-5-like [Lotus japonicus]|uniref:protein S40-5-like n=1 Tax=Lotus japonicus TaxID=34305 RepID=UPI00258E0A1B|nr:protein S40-5-like [Lotus japonicus]
MAKGRKLTTSRSERFLGAYANNHTQAPSDSSELREEDIWSTGDDAGGDVSVWEPDDVADESSGGSAYRRRIHRDVNKSNHHQFGGLSLAFEDPPAGGPVTASARIVHQLRAHDGLASTPRGRHVASSAPMNVPDWSKILRVDSVESLHGVDDDLDESELEVVPPHEYLARSRKKAADSVFVGVGRTLKGRDLSRVRDAVWSQTGFNG